MRTTGDTIGEKRNGIGDSVKFLHKSIMKSVLHEAEEVFK